MKRGIRETKYSVAAIVPNYNYADFIIERINSILNQTYPIDELIVLDDASTDNSIDVIKTKLEEINKKYPSIKTSLLVNKKNTGGRVFAQWKKGIAKTKCDYIWIAEADDSADQHFLEVAIGKFQKHPDAVLFYSDSYRINQDDKILSKTCSDWVDMWKNGRWTKDYYNSGKDEIKNYLSGTNTILNVSSVVWKNEAWLPKIFDEASQYKIAGDWYIYTRVLEYGGIVYSAKPLNRYRKHDKGSASSVVKLSTEYKEVVSVQERVAKKYKLNKDLLKWQKVRRRGMGMVENEKKGGSKGKIAWFVPHFAEGSGGHRTIFQNANKLIERGYECDLYVKMSPPMLPVEIYDRITKWYGKFNGDVFNDFSLAKDYDIVVATGWDTAESVAMAECKKKLYFIQDYEPWFFPMGQEYLSASKSYDYKLRGVSIGNWLPAKLKKEHNLDVVPFSFGADIKTYKRVSGVKKEDAVCFIFQPGKPRRCPDFGLKALQIVQSVRPQTKIYLYGSEEIMLIGKNVKHLGILTPERCNELYNKCTVGLCLSASNPSRIPFEMMAAGLPVVDLYLENNLYDFPEGGCLLAEPDPRAIATAILKILDDRKLAKEMSMNGEKFMKNYPLERGFEEFGDIIDNVMSDKKIIDRVPKKTYFSKAVSPAEFNIKLDKAFRFKTPEEVWRDSLTIPQRVYYKVKYISTKRIPRTIKRVGGKVKRAIRIPRKRR